WSDEILGPFCKTYFANYHKKEEWDQIIGLPCVKKSAVKGNYNFYFALYINKKMPNKEEVVDLSKKFELLRFLHTENKDTILKALECVRRFIILKKLIIVGGMAIDFNLRLKGSKLYADDTLPDY